MDIINKFRKFNLLLQLLIILITILIILYFKNNNKESLINIPKFNTINNNDTFYCKIYDTIHNCSNKNNKIIQIIKDNNLFNSTSTILNIDCKTGEIVNKLSEYNIIGIDKSPNMIKTSKNKYKNSKFYIGDILDNNKKNFDYIYSDLLVLNLSIYYIKNKNLFFKNCYNMLENNGKLLLHLINIEKFNRIVNLCEFNNLSVLKQDKIISKIRFNDFNYTCNFELDKVNKLGYIDETFNFDNGSIKKISNKLFIESINNILNIAIKNSFVIDKTIKLNNNDEYIYILKKSI